MILRDKIEHKCSHYFENIVPNGSICHQLLLWHVLFNYTQLNLQNSSSVRHWYKCHFTQCFQQKPVACTPGSWSVQNSEVCDDCPAGQECPSVASSTHNKNCIPGKCFTNKVWKIYDLPCNRNKIITIMITIIIIILNVIRLSLKCLYSRASEKKMKFEIFAFCLCL